MLKKIKSVFYKLVLTERSPTKLTLSFCLGTFVSFTPIIPFQTPLLIALSWMLRLNTTVAFITLYLVNNPLTLVPIYVVDYLFGLWLFKSVLKLDLSQYNPSWIDVANKHVSKYVDLNPYSDQRGLCFWCLILGGTILALIISVAIYPLMKRIFIRLSKKLPDTQDMSKK